MNAIKQTKFYKKFSSQISAVLALLVLVIVLTVLVCHEPSGSHQRGLGGHPETQILICPSSGGLLT